MTRPWPLAAEQAPLPKAGASSSSPRQRGFAAFTIGAAAAALALVLVLSGCAPAGAALEIEVAASGGSSAINRALEQCGKRGGVVRLGEGTYVCIAPIILRHDGVSLLGAGDGTVLRLADHASCPVIIMGDEAGEPRREVRQVRVAGLRIDGNGTMQKEECWNGKCDTGETTVIRSSGIVIRRATDAQVEDVSIVNCRSGGLVTEKHCRRLTIRRLEASRHEFDALACYETTDSRFEDLRLHDNKAAGISTDIDFNGNVIGGALLERNGTHGIFMRDSRDNTLRNVTIRDSGRDGVFLAQVDEQADTAATGNAFEELTVTGSGGAAFLVAGAECRGNVIRGHEFARNKEGLSETTPGLVEVREGRASRRASR